MSLKIFVTGRFLTKTSMFFVILAPFIYLVLYEFWQFVGLQELVFFNSLIEFMCLELFIGLLISLQAPLLGVLDKLCRDISSFIPHSGNLCLLSFLLVSLATDINFLAFSKNQIWIYYFFFSFQFLLFLFLWLLIPYLCLL